MSGATQLGRRKFLGLAGGAAFGCATAAFSRAGAQAPLPVRIVSTSGAENNTLQQLLKDQGFLEQLGLAAEMVMVTSPPGTLEALISGKGDVCMISGFNGLLPAIEKGAQARVIGAAMRLPALAFYTKSPSIQRVDDLIGKRIGIGPQQGLLHAMVVGLMRRRGLDPSKVELVVVGSNAQVFQAVAEGKVDAGPADVANMAQAAKRDVRALADGLMWQQLPDYPYQLVYASEKAIAERREALIRTLAGYARLYRFLSGGASWSAYSRARMAATGETDPEIGRAAWQFVQDVKPYALDITVSPRQIEFIQELHVQIGSQQGVLPFERVADMSLAQEAVARLG